MVEIKVDEHINFKYHLPQLGEIEAFIWKPYAVGCYRLLQKYDHIKRINRMDQLGVIRNVYEGAHHHRWEYVMLQLYLLNLLQDSKLNIGTNSNVEIDGKEFSGIEILQMWVLMLNSGHLPGTFASEKALLKYCKKDRLFKNSLKNGLPYNKREWFKEDVLKKENVYDVHKVLISFHLERYRRCDINIDGLNIIDTLQRVLDFYIIDEEDDSKREKQKKLRHVFKMIRRVSYLFLDSQYAPFPINFSLSRMLVNVNEWLKDLISVPPSPIVETLDAFENLLSMNLYHSAYSIRELGFHTNEIEKMINEDMASEKLSQIGKLQNYLMYEESTKFQPEHKKEWNVDPFHILFDLSSDYGLQELFRSYLSIETENLWNNRLGTSNCQLTFQFSNNYIHSIINLSFLPKSTENRNIKSLGRFLNLLIIFYLDAKKGIKKTSIDYVIQKPYEEFLIDLFTYITGKKFYFEFKDKSIDKYVIPIKGAKAGIEEINKRIKGVKLSSSRKHEINALLGALNEIDHRSNLFIFLSPLLVYNEDRTHLTDLDGIALGFKHDRLRLLLVEAKKQKHCSISSAKEQLLNSINSLEFKTSDDPVINPLSEFKSAYCYLTIDGE